MKQGGRSGFTIIETVIFLTISSSMAIMLLVGVSSAIQWQQYRDSLQSYANFLRGQHARAVSVKNDRDNTQACPISGASTKARGQSDCVVIGRYITTVSQPGGSDGKRYETRAIYGLEDGSSWRYSLGEVDTTHDVNWGARTRLPAQAENSADISIVMYRDPETGALKVRTSSSRYNSGNIGQIVDNATAPADSLNKREICVYDRGMFMGDQQSIFLGARAGSADAVNIGNASEGCKGE
ncbi:hypothetical protein CR969_02260 [Candidatus Saccharibacteria bacterium]|nr:MAG: hypothetical protein CR969_02260 [Candidatus Saccharibacteria bacterium]